MIVGKISYIHLRHTSLADYVTPKPKGGATIAWGIESTTKNLVIGKPALCSRIDAYNKAIGREIALRNMASPIKVVSEDEYKQKALLEIRDPRGYTGSFTVGVGLNVVNLLHNAIASWPTEAMTINWFELLVRDYFHMDRETGELFFDGRRV